MLSPNKVPDPDGFSVLFIKHFGILIRSDLFLMFQDFYDNNFDLSRLNKALIFLIPKVNDASLIRNFRSISLLNCSYKIFSKVLPIIAKR
jgi:hypothetical protein